VNHRSIHAIPPCTCATAKQASLGWGSKCFSQLWPRIRSHIFDPWRKEALGCGEPEPTSLPLQKRLPLHRVVIIPVNSFLHRKSSQRPKLSRRWMVVARAHRPAPRPTSDRAKKKPREKRHREGSKCRLGRCSITGYRRFGPLKCLQF
jgi:hypothetical protein